MRWSDHNLTVHYIKRSGEKCFFSFGALNRELMSRDYYKNYSLSVLENAIRKFKGKYLNKNISTATEKHYYKKCDYIIDSNMILLVHDSQNVITSFHVHLVKNCCRVCPSDISLSAMLSEHEEFLLQKIISKQYIDVSQFTGFEFLGRRPVFE